MNARLIFLIPFFLTACSLLAPVADDPVRHLLEASVPARATSSGGTTVAVARPSLPPYLERVELVTRTGDGRLEVHEKHLWSEPLDAGITRVVADNLRRITGSTNIQPSSNFVAREYSSLVEIRIERFDPLPDGTLVLECTWKVQPIVGGDASAKSFRTTVPSRPVAEGNSNKMSGRIVAMNDALAQLSRMIAKNL